MARTVKEQEYAVKRNEILDVAQQMIYTKGYEQIVIRDILDAIQISKGAFYHYFDSKQALLEALIERMQQEVEQILVTIVHDPELPALKKFQRFFDVTGRWKTDHKAYLLALVHIWHSDDNAIVRQKVQASTIKHVAPLLTQIIQQGITEGILTTPFPDQVAAMILFLLQGLGESFVELLLSTEPKLVALQQAKQVVAAYTYALEGLLGAPEGSLNLVDAVTLGEWFI
ncbi:MAG: TetR/AcrR family transcriptional regulator [Roseiflexaceae bacterium]|nr:TetR/AcrR family transcriptional regulator [Roseiflexaceae bacterium]